MSIFLSVCLSVSIFLSVCLSISARRRILPQPLPYHDRLCVSFRSRTSLKPHQERFHLDSNNNNPSFDIIISALRLFFGTVTAAFHGIFLSNLCYLASCHATSRKHNRYAASAVGRKGRGPLGRTHLGRRKKE